MTQKVPVEVDGHEYEIWYMREGQKTFKRYVEKDLPYILPRVGEYLILEASEGPKPIEWKVAKITHEDELEMRGLVTYIRIYLEPHVA